MLGAEQVLAVRANALRIRLSRRHNSVQAACYSPLPALVDIPEDLLSQLATELKVTDQELLTPPQTLAEELRRALHEVQPPFEQGESNRPDAKRLAHIRRIFDEAGRLGFTLLAGEAAALGAQVARMVEDYDAALVWAFTAIASPLGHDVESRTQVSWILADVLLRKGYDALALDLLPTVVEALPPTSEQRIRTLINWGNALGRVGHHRRGLRVWTRVLDEAQQGHQDKLLAWGYIGQAAALASLGEWIRASESGAVAERLARQGGWPEMLSYVQSNLLWCQAVAGDIGEARTAIQEALEESETHPALVRSNLLDSWAVVESRAGNWPEVQRLADRAIGWLAEVDPAERLHIKARLLWFRAVAKAHLGIPDAERDKEWATDLLVTHGGDPSSRATLPDWPSA